MLRISIFSISFFMLVACGDKEVDGEKALAELQDRMKSGVNSPWASPNSSQQSSGSQEIIFEVHTVSCKGSSICEVLIEQNRGMCKAMSQSVQSKLNSGWRIVTSSAKEKVASQGVSCVGTEYVIQK